VRSHAENPLILGLLQGCPTKIIARLWNKVVTNKVTQGFRLGRPLLPATDRPAPKPWMLSLGLSHRQLMARENRGSPDSQLSNHRPQLDCSSVGMTALAFLARVIRQFVKQFRQLSRTQFCISVFEAIGHGFCHWNNQYWDALDFMVFLTKFKRRL
jgi:hypothetical protein